MLEATHRVTVPSVVAVHGGIGAVEEEVVRIRTANRTGPIVAGGTNIPESPIAAAAAARLGQF